MSDLMFTTPTGLAAALVDADVRVSPGSPLARRMSLEGDGEAPAWPKGWKADEVLETLGSAPAATLALFALDRVENYYFFEPDGADPVLMVMCGEEVQLVNPASAETFFKSLTARFQPLEAAPPMPVNLDSSVEAFVAMTAAFDYFRALQATSLVMREGVTTFEFEADDLVDQIERGRAVQDFRWFGALVPHLISLRNAAPADLVKKGLKALEKAKLVKAEKGVIIPSSGFLNLALHFTDILPAAIFETPGSKQASARTAILSGRCLWRVDATSKMVTLKAIDGLAMLEAFAAATPDWKS